MSGLVLREDRDGVTVLTLNRPDKLNALTVALFAELRGHVETIARESSVGCVVLRGAGKCFSAGHDLADIAAGEKVPSRGWHSETLRLMERLPQPVIAAVHGHCYTGALEVALAADFILAAEGARFADTHARFALTPIWGMSQRLPRRIGIAKAKYLMFTARTVRGPEAVEMGLAEAAFPDDRFFGEVDAVAREIVDNSPHSHRANKRLLEATDGQALDAGLQWEVWENEGVGPDMQARIERFMTRR